MGVLGFYFPTPNAWMDRGLEPALHAVMCTSEPDLAHKDGAVLMFSDYE